MAIALSITCFGAPAFAADHKYPTGCIPSPRHKLLAVPQHKPVENVPPQFARVAKQISFWGNDQFGCCVTTEEAFAKAATGEPEIFISTEEVVRWARRHGFLHGADLVSVMDAMAEDGFAVGPQLYNDGGYSTVNYGDEPTLQSAIVVGPVKIAIDADALPAAASSNQSGWYVLGGGSFPNTNHCVSICGFGPAEYLYSQISTPLPAALPGTTSGYLVSTWDTYGFVDHPWLMSAMAGAGEAFVRNPTTIGAPPLAPAPTPAPASSALTFGEAVQLVIAAADNNLTDSQAAGVAAFFSDETPRVKLLKDIVYRRALRAGVIPAGTSIDAVNWQGLIQFMNALVPIIEQLMLLFGGGEPHAAIGTPAVLCSTEGSPKYREECGPNGCRLVPIEPAPAQPQARIPARDATPPRATSRRRGSAAVPRRPFRRAWTSREARPSRGSFRGGGGPDPVSLLRKFGTLRGF